MSVKISSKVNTTSLSHNNAENVSKIRRAYANAFSRTLLMRCVQAIRILQTSLLIMGGSEWVMAWW